MQTKLETVSMQNHKRKQIPVILKEHPVFAEYDGNR